MTQFPAYMHSIRKLSQDEQWLRSELRRIDPNCLNEGNDKGNASVRSKTPIVKRQREKHEAMPLTSTIWTEGSYRTGDGEVRQK